MGGVEQFCHPSLLYKGKSNEKERLYEFFTFTIWL